MSDFRRDWAELRERWAMLGRPRQVAIIMGMTLIIIAAAIWFLT